MSAPVDVLAVLRQIADGDGDIEVLAMRAHAAVAELIETQRETLRMLEAAHRQLGMWTGDNKRILRAKAALARIGGAS
jgi:hypothetical protein